MDTVFAAAKTVNWEPLCLLNEHIHVKVGTPYWLVEHSPLRCDISMKESVKRHEREVHWGYDLRWFLRGR